MKNLIVTCLIMVLSASLTKAQIKYTDLTPDITVSNGDSFLLNLNPDSDLFDDFKLFQYTGFGYHMVGASSKWINAILGETQFGYFYPYALALNDPIGNSSTTWEDEIDYELGVSLLYKTTGINPEAYGFWQNLTEDRYLGLRIEYFDQTVRYGWVRISVSDDATSFTIKDYAYNSQAGQTIFAGQKYPVGIDEFHENKQYSHFVSAKTLYIKFLNTEIKEHTITVYDLNGKKIHSEICNNITIQINLDDQNNGIYLLNIENEHGSSSEKFVIF